MGPKERLKLIMDGKQADRPACICPGGMMNMVTAELMQVAGVWLPEAHSDARKMADLAKAVYDHGCFENVGVPFCMTVEAESMGAPVDMGSNVIEPRVIGYVMESVSEYEKLTVMQKPGRIPTVVEAIRMLKEELQGKVPVVGNLTGPISTAGSLMEPMIFYRELRKKNTDAHAFLQYVTDCLIEFGMAQIRAGADVIAISDPSGTGEILGPKYFEEFAVKYLNQMIEEFRAEGVGTIVHICGQMNPVYKQAAEIKSHVLSFDSMVPMQEAKANLPGRVLMGNVSTYALEFGSPEKVASLTKYCAENGSSILSPACGLGMKSPLKNVQAILEAVKWL
ncbi:MAG: methylcobamide--CoM methyltransferase [Lachnospiraceae bacterium]|nr:methylcobamide--CoM methyltransferase [Lachnospiraceae bacterium]